MENEPQYDLDRKSAKISALSSNNLDRYKYLTGEDLGLKPSTIEQAKFEYSPLGKVFNKGLDKDDRKEGLFNRLKNIENAQKNLIRDDDNENIYYTSRSEFDGKDDEDIGLKPLNVFDYLNSPSQEAKDLMDEIKDADDVIDKYRLVFISSNREKFSFNSFRMPLNFLSAIYDGEISLKEAEFLQKDLYNEINELKYNYKPKNAKEEEEINKVLMQANNMLEYRDKIIETFRNGTFLSEYIKKSDDVAYDYVVKDVNNFIHKIKSMKEKINLS